MAFPKRIKKIFYKKSGLVQPRRFMQLGLNSTWANSWENVTYFANLARIISASSWELTSGTGTAITTFGKIQPSNTAAIYRAYLSDSGEGIPSGTYTVRWTGNGSAKLDGFTTTDTAWNTSGSFTYTYTKGNFLGVFFKGTNLDSLQVILPNQVSSYDSGNEWNTDYLAWFISTGSKAIRGMDWITTSQNYESTWADRSVISDLGWTKEVAAAGVSVPYEVQIDFANRTNCDIWLNIPARVDATYAANLGTLIKNNLNSNLKAYVEFGNEIWNTAYPWGDNTSWIRYLSHTRLTATGSSPNRLTKTSHGLSNGSQVVFFQVHGNTSDAWELTGGNICNVTVVDANNFTVKAVYGDGSTPNTTVGKQYIYIVVSENANTNLGLNYSTRFQQLITAMKPNITRSQVYFVMGAQQYNVGDAAARMNAITSLSDIDYLATAPYSNGGHWGTRLNVISGAVTPQVSTTEHYVNIRWGVYLNTATPTDEEVIAGTGSIGFGGVSDTTYLQDYTGTQQVSSLTTSTLYKVVFVATHDINYKLLTRIESIFTPNSVQVIEKAVSNYHKSLIDELNLIVEYAANNGNSLEDHIAISRGIPLITYEGGPHEDRTRPSFVNNALFDYFNSTEFSTVFERTLSQFAIKGLSKFFYYKDVSKTNWGLTRHVIDSNDSRLRSWKTFNGYVPKYEQLASLVDSTPRVSAAPTVPFALRTLIDISGSNVLDSGALSFELISGNSSNRFSISSNVLYLTDITGINFSLSNNFHLIIRASNKYTVDYVLIDVTLGI